MQTNVHCSVPQPEKTVPNRVQDECTHQPHCLPDSFFHNDHCSPARTRASSSRHPLYFYCQLPLFLHAIVFATRRPRYLYPPRRCCFLASALRYPSSVFCSDPPSRSIHVAVTSSSCFPSRARLLLYRKRPQATHVRHYSPTLWTAQATRTRRSSASARNCVRSRYTCVSAASTCVVITIGGHRSYRWRARACLALALNGCAADGTEEHNNRLRGTPPPYPTPRPNGRPCPTATDDMDRLSFRPNVPTDKGHVSFNFNTRQLLDCNARKRPREQTHTATDIERLRWSNVGRQPSDACKASKINFVRFRSGSADIR